MFAMISKSIQLRLLIRVFFLFVLTAGVLTTILILNGRKTIRQMQTTVTNMALEALDKQGQDQMTMSENAIKTKIQSLARLIADSGGVAMDNFDTPTLENLAKQVCIDEDVLSCRFVDKRGVEVAKATSKDQTSAAPPSLRT